jgi:hypothetical protein
MQKHFTSLVAVILIGALWHLSTSAQQPQCNLSRTQTPAIKQFRGLKLWMTSKEVKALVPAIELPPPDEFGLSKTSFSPDFSDKIDKKTFEDIRTVSLEFLDDHLFSIWIGFKETFKWRSADETIAGLTAEMQLPDNWQLKGRERQLTCQDFKIGVSQISGGPAIRMVDETARLQWKARQAAKEDLVEQP